MAGGLQIYIRIDSQEKKKGARMFEFTYADIRNRDFMEGFLKVVNHEMTDFKKAYNLSRLDKVVKQTSSEAQDVFEKLVKGYGKIHDNGTFEIPDEKLAAWKKAQTEFLGQKVKVERHKIRVDDLNGVPLTPSQISALEPFIDDLNGLDD